MAIDEMASDVDGSYSVAPFSSYPFGRTQMSLSRMQAEHGHVLVVAASHLIYRLRHPSHARMTIVARR
jgi:hypothetical protein